MSHEWCNGNKCMCYSMEMECCMETMTKTMSGTIKLRDMSHG